MSLLIKLTDDEREIRDTLKALAGRKVVVLGGVSVNRSTFNTSLSVAGKLEERGDTFRVLLDRQTYAYFSFRDVSIITSPLPGGETEMDGVKAVIRLTFVTA